MNILLKNVDIIIEKHSYIVDKIESADAEADFVSSFDFFGETKGDEFESPDVDFFDEFKS